MERGLVRRVLLGPDSPPHLPLQLPSWTWIVLLVDSIVLIPVFLILDYTLKTLYPIYAMVEHHHTPPSSHATPADSCKHVVGLSSCHSPPAASSSLRSIHRLLRASGGVASNLRGIACAMTQSLATTALVALFSTMFGPLVAPLASLMASLALVQLSTAWVHIVMDAHPSPLPFWLRLPPFRSTLKASWRPVILRWLAVQASHAAPLLVAGTLGLSLPQDIGPNPELDSLFLYSSLDSILMAKCLAVLAVSLVCTLALVVPASVILVRVQASLLPWDCDTLVPFDRSFRGRVESSFVGGRGYATMADAWSTFSSSAWRRLINLYAKILLISLAGVVAVAALIFPQVMLIASKSAELDSVQH